MSTPEESRTLEMRSKILFSSRNRLPVFGAVGRYAVEPRETFNISQLIEDIKIARGSNLQQGEVLPHVAALIDLEMAVELPPEMAAEQPKLDSIGNPVYARVERDTWPLLLNLIQAWSVPPQKQLCLFEDV